jgi:hypothetical protein
MTTTNANEFNVLIFSNNSGIIKTLKKVCRGLHLPLLEAEKETDVLAYHYRIAFIDKKLLSDTLIGGLNALSEAEKPGEWEIAVLGEKPRQLPLPLDVFCKSQAEYTLKAFANIIVKHLPPVKVDPKKLAKLRMHRLVYLKDHLDYNFEVDRKQLCKDLNITERTFFRDVKLIKEVFPDITFYYLDDRY